MLNSQYFLVSLHPLNYLLSRDLDDFETELTSKWMLEGAGRFVDLYVDWFVPYFTLC